MSRDDINPHGFDEFKLQHEEREKARDRVLASYADTRQRVDTLVKSVFVLSGGALTVSIGLFLRPGAPKFAPAAKLLLQWSWWLLFASLAASALITFVMICQGYWQGSMWERQLQGQAVRDTGTRVQRVVQVFNWLVGMTGFCSFLVGLWLLAHVAVTAIV